MEYGADLESASTILFDNAAEYCDYQLFEYLFDNNLKLDNCVWHPLTIVAGSNSEYSYLCAICIIDKCEIKESVAMEAISAAVDVNNIEVFELILDRGLVKINDFPMGLYKSAVANCFIDAESPYDFDRNLHDNFLQKYQEGCDEAYNEKYKELPSLLNSNVEKVD